MQDLIERSPDLEIPDDCDAKRELFIQAISPVKFTINYYDEKAIELWNKSPQAYLPILPWGYHWEKINDKYGLYQLDYALDHNITLVLFGPDERKKINYDLLVDGKNFYTLAHTRPHNVKRLGASDRKYPEPIKTNASGYTAGWLKYMPGHCIDHVDTIIPPADVVKKYGVDCYSSFNPHNYIPEIQKNYWGLTMRKCLVEEQRKLGHNYAQLVEYPDDPILTMSGAAVPESVYFFRLDKQYKPEQISWIDWSKNYDLFKKPAGITMAKHMQKFSTSLEAAPHPWLWDVNYSDRTWRKFVRDDRILGHNIRNKVVKSYKPEKDQLYAYMSSSTFEHTNSYASISTALAASSLNKGRLTQTSLLKAVDHGQRLADLDEGIIPIDKNRFEWVKKFHTEQKPGFEEDDVVDAVKQLSMGQ